MQGLSNLWCLELKILLILHCLLSPDIRGGNDLISSAVKNNPKIRKGVENSLTILKHDTTCVIEPKPTEKTKLYVLNNWAGLI